LPAAREIEGGDNVTEDGINITMAFADLVGSATLVAVTVTTC